VNLRAVSLGKGKAGQSRSGDALLPRPSLGCPGARAAGLPQLSVL